uniref:Uncharacterized protein n=1 Tax=Setaria viridis TaxID=4556 RepID=A0A4U6WHJ6_SETVI|nr:hypothetical protein SEVIR_1G380500v2 [Setaria viridis]
MFEHLTHMAQVAKEVPYEYLKTKRGSTHKDLMKHKLIRQSGLCWQLWLPDIWVIL